MAEVSHGKLIDKIAISSLQDKNLTGIFVRGVVRAYDADHIGLALMLSHMIQKRQFTGGK